MSRNDKMMIVLIGMIISIAMIQFMGVLNV